MQTTFLSSITGKRALSAENVWLSLEDLVFLSASLNPFEASSERAPSPPRKKLNNKKKRNIYCDT